MTLSIRAKVTLSTLLAVTLGFVVAGWLMLAAMERNELARLTEGLEARTRLATTSLQPLFDTPAGSPTRAALRARVAELSRQAHARVTVVAPDGQVLADSAIPGDASPSAVSLAHETEIRRALESGAGSEIRSTQGTGERVFYFALPITGDSRVAGVVRLALPLTVLNAEVAALKRSLGIALGVAFLCSVLLSLFLARGLTRPLSEMAVVARKLADGAFDQRIPTTRRDEVGVLASALNQMAEQLEATIREVSEDRAQLRAMLTAMVEGVMVLDAQGTVLQINPALERMLFTSSMRARGRPHWEVIRHHELNELATQVLETRRNQSGEITIPITGRTFQVEASVAGGYRANEACAVLVFHDVTTLRRLEKVRKDFVANVSHELRTPLTSIQGYAQALKDRASAAPEQGEAFLEIILKQSDRLNFIVEDLLQLSHIESGEVVFRQEPVSLAALAERSEAVIRPQAEKKGHALVIEIPDEFPPVLGDHERLLQVMTNLLDNAVKYTPHGGRIVVSAAVVGDAEKDMVDLAVTDTGIGIPEADRPRIFERFYRVDKARSRELGGTGLGLSIVKHIVDAHHGRVWVEGNEPVGSRFVVRLPLAPSTALI